MKKLALIASLVMLTTPALAHSGKGDAGSGHHWGVSQIIHIGWGHNNHRWGHKGGHSWGGGDHHWGNGGGRVDGPLPLAAGLPALGLIGGVIGLAQAARKRRQG